MKLLKVIGVLGLTASLLFGCSFLIYKQGLLLPGQEMDGIDVSVSYVKDACRVVEAKTKRPLLLTVKSEEHPLYSVVTSSYTVPEYSYLDWLLRKPLTASVVSEVDKEALAEFIVDHDIAYTDASIEQTDNGYILHYEIPGYQLDIEAALNADIVDMKLNLDDFRQMPSVVASDLYDLYDNVSWLNTFKISYADGNVLTGVDLMQYVEDYELDVPDEFLKEFVKASSEHFNTTSGTISIKHPVTGETITVPKKTFGVSLDVDKELKYVKELIESRTPETNRKPIVKGYDELSDTYIAVSIDEQHLWYIKNGEIYSETDIVTGRKGRHDTPKGAFYISECIPGKNLKGDDYVTWVNRWMRLTNTGIGLHDAYWRGSFGGDIYSSNGSHGCINLPKKYAYELYEDAYVGMPVIVF